MTTLQRLLDHILPDLELRGLCQNRRQTFAYRLRACQKLLVACSLPIDHPDFLNAMDWTARAVPALPAMVWSSQQQETLPLAWQQQEVPPPQQ